MGGHRVGVVHPARALPLPPHDRSNSRRGRRAAPAGGARPRAHKPHCCARPLGCIAAPASHAPLLPAPLPPRSAHGDLSPEEQALLKAVFFLRNKGQVGGGGSCCRLCSLGSGARCAGRPAWHPPPSLHAARGGPGRLPPTSSPLACAVFLVAFCPRPSGQGVYSTHAGTAAARVAGGGSGMGRARGSRLEGSRVRRAPRAAGGGAAGFACIGGPSTCGLPPLPALPLCPPPGARAQKHRGGGNWGGKTFAYGASGSSGDAAESAASSSSSGGSDSEGEPGGLPHQRVQTTQW